VRFRSSRLIFLGAAFALAAASSLDGTFLTTYKQQQQQWCQDQVETQLTSRRCQT
jgi:hypothetical protein